MVSLIRRVAQRIRHDPRLSFLDPIWSMLRKPYVTFMRVFGRRRGIAVEIAGSKMRLHPDFCSGNWENIEVESYRAFAANVQTGSVVFDVGAHIGTYTIIAVQNAGTRGRVIAYEPNASAREYLIMHLLWNNSMAQTTVRDICCGAETGTSDFFHKPGQAEGTSGLIPVEGFSRSAALISTLDQEVTSLGLVPNVIKIDVEGTEWDVLKGAEDILRRHRPVLFLSLHPGALATRNESADEVMDWLEQRGYVYEVIAVDHEVHVLARSVKLNSR